MERGGSGWTRAVVGLPRLGLGCSLVLLLFTGALLDARSAAAYAVLDDGGGIFTEGWDGAGTGSATLFYSLAQGTADLANELQVIELALTEWASVVDITFIRTSTPGRVDALDFYFSFDAFVADGPAGGLALGFGPDDIVTGPRFGIPNAAGDIFFDDSELWSDYSAGPGTCNAGSCDLFHVALHEIGHALGLDHPLGDFVNDPAGVVLNPFFNPPGQGFGSFTTLQPDDIAGIQSLYASGSGAVINPEPASGSLLAAGLVGLGAWRRRRLPAHRSRLART